MTTIYLLRRSQPFRKLLGEYSVNEVEQLRNEKNPLSVDGEKLAREMSERSELQNIDVIYSSHYVRTVCTAKYIAENNNIKLNDKKERLFNFTSSLINQIAQSDETLINRICDELNNESIQTKLGISKIELQNSGIHRR